MALSPYDNAAMFTALMLCQALRRCRGQVLGCLWIAFLRIPCMRSTFETATIHGCVRRHLNWRHRDTTKSSRDPLDKELVCTSCRACNTGACISTQMSCSA